MTPRTTRQRLRSGGKITPEGPYGPFPEYMEKDFVLKAVRGKEANYTQDGSQLDAVIRELLQQHMSWIELRANDDSLLDDGVDDSWAHLREE